MSPDDPALSAEQALRRAVKDLWSTVVESGDDYVVFLDRRRAPVRVYRHADGLFRISWEQPEDGPALEHEHAFENPREAAFHAYQGPH